LDFEAWHMTVDERNDSDWIDETLGRLSRSAFRSKFRLDSHDADYAQSKGPETLARHAHDMLRKRVGPAHPAKDGRQTPWRGHPVFTAQHATATCCRGCIEKWHGIPRGRALSDEELDRLADLVMTWISRQMASRHPRYRSPTLF
jgi:hypothetical protein